MEPIILEGKYTSAKIYAQTVESGVISQTMMLCNHPIFVDAPIRIMPDCHEGAGCTIGFTSPIPKNGEIIPNIIGVDQSCGMLTVKLADNPHLLEELAKLDAVIHEKVPCGIHGHEKIQKGISQNLIDEVTRYNKDCLKRDETDDLRKIGSLGGGNHFISIECGDTGNYLIIHSGSRNFGNEMARYFQRIAIEKNCYGSGEYKSLSWLDGNDAQEYWKCAQVCNEYSKTSRYMMAHIILSNMGWTATESFETIHNYIAKDGIIRKGAISCKENEQVLIPLNMRDGSLLCLGKGNEDWNNSGPHGAGRVLSRSAAKQTLSLEDYEKSMEGIFTTCVSNGTLDEAPMAYKDGSEIMLMIEPTAKIVDHLKPVYNFKA